MTAARPILLAMSMLTLWAPAASALPSTVGTRSGPVRGTGTDVMAFKGIPYAAPPTGGLRWRAPVPPRRWTTTRDAVDFGPQCPQLSRTPVPPLMSEDCLTLNVWTPARAAGDRLPVIVWLHGGGFQFGSGSAPETDGAALARRGVVLVTLNYRLGALGFLAHPALSRESSRKVSGNYGLLDQILALQWVRDNISGFGGDPRNVTLMGESAGAWSAGILMASPLAKTLFHRVMAFSVPRLVGPKQHLRQTYYGQPSAESQGARLIPDIAALRALPATEVLSRLRPDPTFGAGLHFFPVVDGYVQPEDAGDRAGTAARPALPLLLGHAADEGLFFRPQAPKTVAEYRRFLETRFAPEFVAPVRNMYPARNDTEANDAALRSFADSEVVAATLLFARRSSLHGPVYVYRFARVSPLSRATWGGATHTADLPYWFDNVTDDAAQFEPRDRLLAGEMAGACVQFARTGNPNGPSLPDWPAYHAPEFHELEYGDVSRVGTNAGNEAVELFERAWEATRVTQLLER